MQVPLQKWGNSQGVRIGKQIAEQAGLQIGQQVELVLCEEGILLRAVPGGAPVVDLQAMLRKIPETGSTPEELSWGERVGNEVW